MNTIAKQQKNKRLISFSKAVYLPPVSWEKVEEARFALIPALLLLTGCLGGIAAAFGAEYSTFQLALVTFPTILSLALVLGVAPMKPIVYLSGTAMLLDLLILIF